MPGRHTPVGQMSPGAGFNFIVITKLTDLRNLNILFNCILAGQMSKSKFHQPEYIWLILEVKILFQGKHTC